MSAYELETHASDDGDVVHVVISGELDLTNARELELRLDEAARADARLVLDLSSVSFIDSAALHVLFKLARPRGPEQLAIVVPPTSPIARTLAIVGLEQAAAIVDSPDALDAPGGEG